MQKDGFLIFHSPKKPLPVYNELLVNEFSIKRVSHIKYLGVHIPENLKWDKHVDHLCGKLASNFHLFYSIRNLLTDELKRQLFFALVYSRINYGIELYGASRASLLNRVQVMQNKLLKVLYELPYRTSTDTLHCRLRILKVLDVYKLRILKFVHESINEVSISQ